MKLILPEYVELILEKLYSNNYEGFIVGGSVRDLLLGKEPADYDITTNATPDEIEEVFKDFKTVNVGKRFGTIVVISNGNKVEITTYRIEGEYLDGRRPSEVRFSKNIEEDLSRRDFTINAMAYNRRAGLVDPFDGKIDLEKGIIRTVGNPKERFEEDYLRILRAIRFSAQLEFEIEENTYNACKEQGKLLSYISVERIREELFKILLCRKPSYGINLIKDLDILEVIIPELVDAVGFDQCNPHHNKNVFDHIMCVVDNTPAVLATRLAALFHDIGKPHTLTIDEKGVGHFYGHDKVGAEIAHGILIRLKCSNEMINNVTTLIREHMSHHANMKSKGLKRQISRVGKEEIFNLLDLQKADRSCSSENVDISFLFDRERKIKEILENGEPYEKNQLKIHGNDIIDLGFERGKLIGEILDYLMEKVIADPRLNDYNKLKEIVLKKFGSRLDSE